MSGQAKMKKTIFLSALIIIAVLAFSNITASSNIGIAPAYTSIEYEPGSEKEAEARIYDSSGEGLNATLSIEGALSEYFSISEEKIEIFPGEKVHSIRIFVRMPAGIPPGEYRTDIIAAAQASGKGTIGVMPSVSMQIYTSVLSEKYLYANVNGSEDKTLSIKTKNIGLKEISSASISVKITGGEIEKYSKETELGRFSPGEEKKFGQKLNALNGDYSAKILLKYDGEERTIEKPVKIGRKEITPGKIEIPVFKTGEINRVILYTKSNWNNPTETEPKIQVHSAERLVAELKANNFSAINEQQTEFFWDTAGLAEGEYALRAVLGYDSKITEKDFLFTLSDNKISIEEKSSRDRRRIIIIAIIAASLIALLSAAALIKRKTKNSKLEKIINRAVKYAEYRDVEKAASLYSKIRSMYEKLPEKEKKIFYSRIMKVYAFIKNQKNKKIEF
jgi:hypothetical protein